MTEGGETKLCTWRSMKSLSIILTKLSKYSPTQLQGTHPYPLNVFSLKVGGVYGEVAFAL